MPSISYDLGFLQAGVESLDGYLKSNKLFWALDTPSTISAPAYPRLTIGNILLSMKRLETRVLLSNQSKKIMSFKTIIDHYRYHRRAAWIRKVDHEYSSRFRQWNHYLQELKPNFDYPNDFFCNEVRVRVVIELLMSELDVKEKDFFEPLKSLDLFLQRITIPGQFVWDDDLSSGFNPKEYWFLWVKLNLEASFFSMPY